MQISKEQVLKVLEAYLRKQRDNGKHPDNRFEINPKEAIKTPEVCHLRDTIEQIPEVRTERVEPIEKKLRDGQYAMDEEEIAEKIVFRAAADTLIIQDK